MFHTIDSPVSYYCFSSGRYKSSPKKRLCTHPFTAPSAMPSAKYFCRNG